MAAVEDRKPVSVEAKPVWGTGATLSVFSSGPYSPNSKTVNKPWFGNSPPKPLYIVSPKDKGTYQVIVFFHGTSLGNTSYSKLFDHLASHGYIVVAPQLYDLLPPKGNQEVDDAAKVLNWLPEGLQSKLPDNIEANLNFVALMGHSRGGLIAFALALGYATSSLKFSALVGIDPVAGSSSVHSELKPPILSYESFNFSIPVTVIGTRLGGVIKCKEPCAPEDKNHEQFFNRCTYSDRAHFDATDYGHMDMLDDNPRGPKSWAISKCLCTNGNKPRDPMRRCVGGIAVAFLKGYFDCEFDDFNTILKEYRSVAPIMLDEVDFFPSARAQA